MKRASIMLMLAMAWLPSFAQVKFEKGYFIDKDGNKVECLIKNNDWKNNPKAFEYVRTEQDEPTLMNASQVREFGINDVSKYVSRLVKIDRSSNLLAKLSTQRDPIWSEEQLFLYVLHEAQGSFYTYKEGNLIRFFYNVNDNPVRQLIYKKYLNDAGVATNFDFRQQLWTDFKCPDAALETLKDLSYTKKSLLKYFRAANACRGDNNTAAFKPKTNKVSFHLRIRPGVEYTGLKIWHAEDSRYGVATFDKQLTYRIGIQAECILPYNKNKWAIIIEPAFQYFNDEESMSTGAGSATISYRSIEVPIGVRRYFFISDRSKIFLNAFLVMDRTFDSFLKFKNDPLFKAVNPRPGLAVGGGYELNKLSIKFRYIINRRILGDYLSWESQYNKVSFIVGYKVF